MIVTKINNHVQQALARLLQQYQGLPLLSGFLTALIAQIQNLEDAIYPLDALRQLQNAYGQQLDNLGQIIGLSRNGMPDNEYFILLLGTIAEDNSDTTAPALLYIVQTVFQAANVFIKDPNSPGGEQPDPSLVNAARVAFCVQNPSSPASLDTVIQQIIQNSIGAGISLVYLSTFTGATAVCAAGPQSWVGGCSDLNNPLPTDAVIAGLVYNNKAE